MTVSVVSQFQVVLGPWNPKSTIFPFRAQKWPFQAPKTLRFKGKMPNFEATNTVKLGKKTPKGQLVPISRAYRGGFQRLSEVFRGFQRFLVFRGFSEALSEILSEADFPLRGSQFCCP